MARLPAERAQGTPETTSKQPRVDTTLKSATDGSHRKLIETAYQLAKTPTMPLSRFNLLCEVQQKNGVNLLPSKYTFL